MTDLPKGFYVYQYIREDGTPYYIGKGKDNRAWIKHKNVEIPTDKKHINIIVDNLSELEAFEIEMRLIWHYGRKIFGTGILENITDGSESFHLAKGRVKKRQTTGRCQGRFPIDVIAPDAVAYARKLNSDQKRKPSLRKIAAALADAGFLTESGKTYSATTIRAMLKKDAKKVENP